MAPAIRSFSNARETAVRTSRIRSQSIDGRVCAPIGNSTQRSKNTDSERGCGDRDCEEQSGYQAAPGQPSHARRAEHARVQGLHFNSPN